MLHDILCTKCSNQSIDLFFHFTEVWVSLQELFSKLAKLIEFILMSPDVITKVLVTLQQVFCSCYVACWLVGVEGIFNITHPVQQAL